MNLNLELASWHARNLGRHHRIYPEVSQRSSDQAAGEGHKLWTGLQILSVLACLGQELETVILEDVHTLMVGSQVVYLLPARMDSYTVRKIPRIIYLKTATQKSLQMNLRRSSSSLNLG